MHFRMVVAARKNVDLMFAELMNPLLCCSGMSEPSVTRVLEVCPSASGATVCPATSGCSATPWLSSPPKLVRGVPTSSPRSPKEGAETEDSIDDADARLGSGGGLSLLAGSVPP